MIHTTLVARLLTGCLVRAPAFFTHVTFSARRLLEKPGATSRADTTRNAALSSIGTARCFLRIAALVLGLATILPAQSATPKKQLPPLPPPSLPVALYLTWQRAPAETMTVHWHTEWTNGYSDSVLEYRTAAATDTPWSRATGHVRPMPFTDRMIHTVELTGLKDDMLYQFRFGRLVTRESDNAMTFQPHGPAHTFRTLPATLSRPVRFVSGGDIYGGTTPGLMPAMCRVAAGQDPDFAILGGDIAYVNNNPRNTRRWFDFFRIWGETMVAPDGRIIPVVPTIGNHEAHGDSYDIPGGGPHRGISPDRALFFYTLFAFPGRPGYNVLDIGNYLSLVALDSYHSNPVPGAQTEWLRDTLAQRRDVPLVVPFYHVPAYPSVRPFGSATSVAIRANWVPLFDEAGVRFVFENHDHSYKVTHPMRGGVRNAAGTRYLGDGAWAVDTRKPRSPEKAPYLARTEAKNHVFVVTLHPDRADVAAIDLQGEVFDRFSIGGARH